MLYSKLPWIFFLLYFSSDNPLFHLKNINGEPSFSTGDENSFLYPYFFFTWLLVNKELRKWPVYKSSCTGVLDYVQCSGASYDVEFLLDNALEHTENMCVPYRHKNFISNSLSFCFTLPASKAMRPSVRS